MAGAIAILTYHSLDDSGSVVSVTPSLFSAQMAALSDAGWRGVSMVDAIDERNRTGYWPDRSVVITFDDGFANFAQFGIETLRRHGFGATVYVISAHVGGRNNWAPPPDGLGERAMMTWMDLARAARGGIEIGAHTRSHPNLAALPPEQIEDELSECKEAIEERLDLPVRTFAYPYGLMNKHAQSCAGRLFEAACTTLLARASDESPATLPRVDAYFLHRVEDAVRCVEGRMDPYLAIRRWGRSAKSLVMRLT